MTENTDAQKKGAYVGSHTNFCVMFGRRRRRCRRKKRSFVKCKLTSLSPLLFGVTPFRSKLFYWGCFCAERAKTTATMNGKCVCMCEGLGWGVKRSPRCINTVDNLPQTASCSLFIFQEDRAVSCLPRFVFFSRMLLELVRQRQRQKLAVAKYIDIGGEKRSINF